MFSRYLGCPNSIGVHIVDVVVPIPLTALGQWVETTFYSMQADKVRRPAPARQPQYADRMRKQRKGVAPPETGISQSGFKESYRTHGLSNQGSGAEHREGIRWSSRGVLRITGYGPGRRRKEKEGPGPPV